MSNLIVADQLAALGHPVRLKIMSHLACEEGRCCRDVVECINLAQSTVSQHLKILVEAGLVDYVREGKRSRYTVNTRAIEELSESFRNFASTCCATTGACCSRKNESGPQARA